jgi:hypothetical protein
MGVAHALFRAAGQRRPVLGMSKSAKKRLLQNNKAGTVEVSSANFAKFATSNK